MPRDPSSRKRKLHASSPPVFLSPFARSCVSALVRSRASPHHPVLARSADVIRKAWLAFKLGQGAVSPRRGHAVLVGLREFRAEAWVVDFLKVPEAAGGALRRASVAFVKAVCAACECDRAAKVDLVDALLVEYAGGGRAGETMEVVERVVGLVGYGDDEAFFYRAWKLGALDACRRKVRAAVEELVEFDINGMACDESIARSLLQNLSFLKKSLTFRVHRLFSTQINVLSTLAFLESLNIQTLKTGLCVAETRAIIDALGASPDLVVEHASVALAEMVPRFAPNFAASAPFINASKVVLQEVIAKIVPKKKIPHISMLLQRAATQEDYFPHKTIKSSVSLADIPPEHEGGTPKVQDLRLKIAKDLSMEVELLELIVADKIIGPELDLAEVHEYVWKPYVAERARIAAARRPPNLGSIRNGPPPPSSSVGNSISRSFMASQNLLRHLSGLASVSVQSASLPPGSLPSGDGSVSNPFSMFRDEDLSEDDDDEEDTNEESQLIMHINDVEDEEADDDDEEIMSDIVSGNSHGNSAGASSMRADTVSSDANKALVAAADFIMCEAHMYDDDDDEIDDNENHDEEENGGGDDHAFARMLLGTSSSGGGGATTSPATKNNFILPMIVTYRLCAVDGEATEDFLSEIPASSAYESSSEFFAATAKLGNMGFQCLIRIVSFTIEMGKAWPSAACRQLLFTTLIAFDQVVRHPPNCGTLLKLGALHPLLTCLIDTPNDSILNDLCMSILDRLMNESSADSLDDFAPGHSQMTDNQMDWILERLEGFSNKPNLVLALCKLVPQLIYGRLEKAQNLGSLVCGNLHKPWAIHVVEHLSKSSDSNLLRDVLFELGLTRSACDQVALCYASSADELASNAMISLVSTVQNLKLLKGLVREHALTCSLVCTTGKCLHTLIRLEEVSSSRVEFVGSYAYEIIMAMSDSGMAQVVRDAVKQAQVEHINEKRSKAKKRKNRAIKSMALYTSVSPIQVSDDSRLRAPPDTALSLESVAKKAKWMEEISKIEDEELISCAVCRDGYRSKPSQLMCVYTFEKSVPFPKDTTFVSSSHELMRSPQSRVLGVCSSTSFVCIHQSCHDLAARADRSHSKPKSEWEGAELRNTNVRCNNLIPLKGSYAKMSYTNALNLFFIRVDPDARSKLHHGGLGSMDPSRFSLVAHDLRILLLRISYGESLAEDTRGGSIESNLKLVVPFMQMGFFLLESDNGQKVVVQKALKDFVERPDGGDLATAAVFSLFCMNAKEWNDVRVDSFFKKIALHATRIALNAMAGDSASLGSGATLKVENAALEVVAVARSRARSRAKSLLPDLSGLDDEFEIPKSLRPWLVYMTLIDFIAKSGDWVKNETTAMDSATAMGEMCRVLVQKTQSVIEFSKLLDVPIATIRDCVLTL